MQQDPPPAAPPVAELAALLSAGGASAPSLLADRPDATVVRVGDAVAKAHAPGTDTAALAVRLRLAADPVFEGVLLPPLRLAPVVGLCAGRPVTAWPYGAPVDPSDPGAAPWEEAGALLARLHAASLPELARRHGPLPAMRGPAKAAAAMSRLRSSVPHLTCAAAGEPDAVDAPGTADARLVAARTVVEQAWARLPAWCRDEGEPPAARPRALCHGDFHLGQVVRHPAPAGRWKLIDPDDLGTGDPAWDLARPAAWYAAGLLPPAAWELLLAGYRSRRLPPGEEAGEDLWVWLDHPARTLAVQTAAIAVAKAARQRRTLDEDEEALLGACSRIVELPGHVRP